MARVKVVGPLRLWAKHGTGRAGDIIVCEHNGERAEYPRSNRSARSELAWRAYAQDDIGAATTYPHVPKG